jgi:peptide deformylase
MAQLQLVPQENTTLHQKAKPVRRFNNSALLKLVRNMFETMRKSGGVGLAAPQIGESIRVCVVEYDGRSAVLINPEIVKAEGETLGTEGCLSIPGYVGDNIRRAEKITVRSQDAYGRQSSMSVEGWFARIIQHEIDHLDGILFLDRLDRPEDLRETNSEQQEGAQEESTECSESVLVQE